MSKYTKEEQEFLDKVALAAIPGIVLDPRGYTWGDCANHAYELAEELLTERKKLFGDD